MISLPENREVADSERMKVLLAAICVILLTAACKTKQNHFPEPMQRVPVSQ